MPTFFIPLITAKLPSFKFQVLLPSFTFQVSSLAPKSCSHVSRSSFKFCSPVSCFKFCSQVFNGFKLSPSFFASACYLYALRIKHELSHEGGGGGGGGGGQRGSVG